MLAKSPFDCILVKSHVSCLGCGSHLMDLGLMHRIKMIPSPSTMHRHRSASLTYLSSCTCFIDFLMCSAQTRGAQSIAEVKVN